MYFWNHIKGPRGSSLNEPRGCANKCTTCGRTRMLSKSESNNECIKCNSKTVVQPRTVNMHVCDSNHKAPCKNCSKCGKLQEMTAERIKISHLGKQNNNIAFGHNDPAAVPVSNIIDTKQNVNYFNDLLGEPIHLQADNKKEDNKQKGLVLYKLGSPIKLQSPRKTAGAAQAARFTARTGRSSERIATAPKPCEHIFRQQHTTENRPIVSSNARQTHGRPKELNVNERIKRYEEHLKQNLDKNMCIKPQPQLPVRCIEEDVAENKLQQNPSDATIYSFGPTSFGETSTGSERSLQNRIKRSRQQLGRPLAARLKKVALEMIAKSKIPVSTRTFLAINKSKLRVAPTVKLAPTNVMKMKPGQQALRDSIKVLWQAPPKRDVESTIRLTHRRAPVTSVSQYTRDGVDHTNPDERPHVDFSRTTFSCSSFKSFGTESTTTLIPHNANLTKNSSQASIPPVAFFHNPVKTTFTVNKTPEPKQTVNVIHRCKRFATTPISDTCVPFKNPQLVNQSAGDQQRTSKRQASQPAQLMAGKQMKTRAKPPTARQHAFAKVVVRNGNNAQQLRKPESAKYNNIKVQRQFPCKQSTVEGPRYKPSSAAQPKSAAKSKTAREPKTNQANTNALLIGALATTDSTFRKRLAAGGQWNNMTKTCVAAVASKTSTKTTVLCKHNIMNLETSSKANLPEILVPTETHFENDIAHIENVTTNYSASVDTAPTTNSEDQKCSNIIDEQSNDDVITDDVSQKIADTVKNDNDGNASDISLNIPSRNDLKNLPTIKISANESQTPSSQPESLSIETAAFKPINNDDTETQPAPITKTTQTVEADFENESGQDVSSNELEMYTPVSDSDQIRSVYQTPSDSIETVNALPDEPPVVEKKESLIQQTIRTLFSNTQVNVPKADVEGNGECKVSPAGHPKQKYITVNDRSELTFESKASKLINNLPNATIAFREAIAKELKRTINSEPLKQALDTSPYGDEPAEGSASVKTEQPTSIENENPVSQNSVNSPIVIEDGLKRDATKPQNQKRMANTIIFENEPPVSGKTKTYSPRKTQLSARIDGGETAIQSKRKTSPMRAKRPQKPSPYFDTDSSQDFYRGKRTSWRYTENLVSVTPRARRKVTEVPSLFLKKKKSIHNTAQRTYTKLKATKSKGKKLTVNKRNTEETLKITAKHLNDALKEVSKMLEVTSTEDLTEATSKEILVVDASPDPSIWPLTTRRKLNVYDPQRRIQQPPTTSNITGAIKKSITPTNTKPKKVTFVSGQSANSTSVTVPTNRAQPTIANTRTSYGSALRSLRSKSLATDEWRRSRTLEGARMYKMPLHSSLDSPSDLDFNEKVSNEKPLNNENGSDRSNDILTKQCSALSLRLTKTPTPPPLLPSIPCPAPSSTPPPFVTTIIPRPTFPPASELPIVKNTKGISLLESQRKKTVFNTSPRNKTNIFTRNATLPRLTKYRNALNNVRSQSLTTTQPKVTPKQCRKNVQNSTAKRLLTTIQPKGTQKQCQKDVQKSTAKEPLIDLNRVESEYKRSTTPMGRIIRLTPQKSVWTLSSASIIKPRETVSSIPLTDTPDTMAAKLPNSTVGTSCIHCGHQRPEMCDSQTQITRGGKKTRQKPLKKRQKTNLGRATLMDKRTQQQQQQQPQKIDLFLFETEETTAKESTSTIQSKQTEQPICSQSEEQLNNTPKVYLVMSEVFETLKTDEPGGDAMEPLEPTVTHPAVNNVAPTLKLNEYSNQANFTKVHYPLGSNPYESPIQCEAQKTKTVIESPRRTKPKSSVNNQLEQKVKDTSPRSTRQETADSTKKGIAPSSAKLVKPGLENAHWKPAGPKQHSPLRYQWRPQFKARKAPNYNLKPAVLSEPQESKEHEEPDATELDSNNLQTKTTATSVALKTATVSEDLNSGNVDVRKQQVTARLETVLPLLLDNLDPENNKSMIDSIIAATIDSYNNHLDINKPAVKTTLQKIVSLRGNNAKKQPSGKQLNLVNKKATNVMIPGTSKQCVKTESKINDNDTEQTKPKKVRKKSNRSKKRQIRLKRVKSKQTIQISTNNTNGKSSSQTCVTVAPTAVKSLRQLQRLRWHTLLQTKRLPAKKGNSSKTMLPSQPIVDKPIFLKSTISASEIVLKPQRAKNNRTATTRSTSLSPQSTDASRDRKRQQQNRALNLKTAQGEPTFGLPLSTSDTKITKSVQLPVPSNSDTKILQFKQSSCNNNESLLQLLHRTRKNVCASEASKSNVATQPAAATQLKRENTFGTIQFALKTKQPSPMRVRSKSSGPLKPSMDTVYAPSIYEASPKTENISQTESTTPMNLEELFEELPATKHELDLDTPLYKGFVHDSRLPTFTPWCQTPKRTDADELLFMQQQQEQQHKKEQEHLQQQKQQQEQEQYHQQHQQEQFSEHNNRFKNENLPISTDKATNACHSALNDDQLNTNYCPQRFEFANGTAGSRIPIIKYPIKERSVYTTYATDPRQMQNTFDNLPTENENETAVLHIPSSDKLTGPPPPQFQYERPVAYEPESLPSILKHPKTLDQFEDADIIQQAPPHKLNTINAEIKPTRTISPKLVSKTMENANIKVVEPNNAIPQIRLISKTIDYTKINDKGKPLVTNSISCHQFFRTRQSKPHQSTDHAEFSGAKNQSPSTSKCNRRLNLPKPTTVNKLPVTTSTKFESQSKPKCSQPIVKFLGSQKDKHQQDINTHNNWLNSMMAYIDPRVPFELSEASDTSDHILPSPTESKKTIEPTKTREIASNTTEPTSPTSSSQMRRHHSTTEVTSIEYNINWELRMCRNRAQVQLYEAEEVSYFRSKSLDSVTGQNRSCKPTESNAPPKPSTPKVQNNSTFLSRVPITCPIHDCHQIIGVSALMGHILRDHKNANNFKFTELYMKEQWTIKFNPRNLEYRKNHCIGFIAYGGIKGERPPAERGQCMYNTTLHPKYVNINVHLPIMVMACKAPMSCMLQNKELEAAYEAGNPETMEQIIIIWLLCPQLITPIYSTITAYGRNMDASRCRIVQLRTLNEPQNPSLFIPYETNYLCLSSGDVKVLTNQLSFKYIYLEIIINEN